VETRTADQAQGGQAGGHRQRVTRQGAGLVDRAQRGDARMISRLPPKQPTGMPPPMILPKVVRSGVTP
jgi:hypothetical protein